MRFITANLNGVRSAASKVTLEESLWVDEHGHIRPSQQIVMSGTVSGGGGNYGWLIKHMG